jgi:hypothetical protein
MEQFAREIIATARRRRRRRGGVGESDEFLTNFNTLT